MVTVNATAFLTFLKWVRVLATHCTASDPSWWQAFPVYKTFQNRLRPLVQIDDPTRQIEEFQKLLAQVPR